MSIVFVGDLDRDRGTALACAAGAQQVVTVPSVGSITARDDQVQALVGVTGVVDEALALLPNLRWVHSAAAGVDGTLSERVRDSPIVLTSATGNGAIPLAEHALMMMLMLNRDAMRWVRAQTEHRWDRFTHDELYGKTLGILGLGNSGRHLARAASALGMTVIALSRHGRPNLPDGVRQMYGPADLHAFLSRCDVVVITAPRTPDTLALIDQTALAVMRPTAQIICISRGGIIDDDALLRALDTGQIAGAGLDAHGTEPLPAASPFWSHPRVLVTPHNGATTAATGERGWQILIENVSRFVADEPLHNVVDKHAGY